jgi:hypothetical protein
METEEKAGAFETIGAALAGAVVVILIYLVAITVWTTAARAGGYGEYSGQSWAERAMSGDHSRVRGKPQYEPGGGYYREHYHGDRYSRGNHRIKVQPHSHRHHRERGYSSVTHVHEVAHRHVYRPRYTHPRYTHHYRRWRPQFHYAHRPWQERAWQRYVTIRVPIDRYGQIIPGHGYRSDDYRDPRDRAYFERIRHEELARRGYGYRDDPRDRYGYQSDDRPRRECRAPITHYGETRMGEEEAKLQAKVGWAAAVGLEHGLKYADWKHARKKSDSIRCFTAGYKEEGVEQTIDKLRKAFTGKDAWKKKCIVVAMPCAPSSHAQDADDNDEPDGDHNEEPAPGPTR